jgi:hypothetical protein
MALICEDLARYGVVLIPPSTREYFQLLAGIERTLQARPKGSPPVDGDALSRISEHDTSGSAILVNQAPVAIASLAYAWTFRTREGRDSQSFFLPGTTASVLLPFCLQDRTKKFDAFWNTIFPTSKRLITSEGIQYGDNTDVRAPAQDELWDGGFFSGRAGSRGDRGQPVKLTIDGVFFVDGGFAGPDTLGLWEHTTLAAEEYVASSALARQAREKSTPPDAFFQRMEAFSGYKPFPSPPPSFAPPFGPPDLEAIRKQERWVVGVLMDWLRKQLGDEAAMTSIAAWSDAPAPKLHKLDH